jgi:hypothetical protein
MGFTESPFKTKNFRSSGFGSILTLQFNKIMIDIFNIFSNFALCFLPGSFCLNQPCPFPAIIT